MDFPKGLDLELVLLGHRCCSTSLECKLSKGLEFSDWSMTFLPLSGLLFLSGVDFLEGLSDTFDDDFRVRSERA